MAELDDLRAEVSDLRVRLAALEGEERTSRRDLLRRAGLAAAGGVGAALAFPRAASAADGQTMTIGGDHPADTNMQIFATSSFPTDDVLVFLHEGAAQNGRTVHGLRANAFGQGVGVSGRGGASGGAGVSGKAQASAATGVVGIGAGASDPAVPAPPTGTGVAGSASTTGTGVFGSGGIYGVLGTATNQNGIGVQGLASGASTPALAGNVGVVGGGGLFGAGVLARGGTSGRGIDAMGGPGTGSGSAGDGAFAVGGDAPLTGIAGRGIWAQGGNASLATQIPGVGALILGGTGLASNAGGGLAIDARGGSAAGTGAGGGGIIAVGGFGTPAGIGVVAKGAGALTTPPSGPNGVLAMSGAGASGVLAIGFNGTGNNNGTPGGEGRGGTGAGTGPGGPGFHGTGGLAPMTGGVGVHGQGGSPNGTGVFGRAFGANFVALSSGAGGDFRGGTPTTTNASGGAGVIAQGGSGNGSGANGRGVIAMGVGTGAARSAPLQVEPSSTVSGPPTSGDRSRGDVWVDNSGAVFNCVVSGAPGTWFRVGGFNPLPTPFRLVDTRFDDGGVMGPSERRAFTIAPSGTSPNNIPGGGLISSVMINVTGVPTAGHVASYFTVLPHDAPAIPPGDDAPYSNVNWVAGQLQANLVTVRVPAGTGQIDVFNRFGNVHLIVDVVGFFG